MQSVYLGFHNSAGFTWLANTLLHLRIKIVWPFCFTWNRQSDGTYTATIHDYRHAEMMPIFKTHQQFTFDRNVRVFLMGHYPLRSLLDKGRTIFMCRDVRDSYFTPLMEQLERKNALGVPPEAYPHVPALAVDHSVFPLSALNNWSIRQDMWELAAERHDVLLTRFEDCKFAVDGVRRIIEYIGVSRTDDELREAMENSNGLGRHCGVRQKWKQLPEKVQQILVDHNAYWLERRGYLTETVQTVEADEKQRFAHTLMALFHDTHPDILRPDYPMRDFDPSDMERYLFDMYINAVIIYFVSLFWRELRHTHFACVAVSGTTEQALQLLERVQALFPRERGLMEMYRRFMRLQAVAGDFTETAMPSPAQFVQLLKPDENVLACMGIKTFRKG